jgi:hypothetical protein
MLCYAIGHLHNCKLKNYDLNELDFGLTEPNNDLTEPNNDLPEPNNDQTEPEFFTMPPHSSLLSLYTATRSKEMLLSTFQVDVVLQVVLPIVQVCFLSTTNSF